MKDNLSLAGSEIINGNNNINKIDSFISVKNGQKLITKSYNLINTPIKEKTNINKYSEKKPSESIRGFSLDLSKIMYNDGCILTDAVNSNPGFGLWAIKGSPHKERNQTINNTHNRKKTNKALTNKKLIKNIINEKNNIDNNRYNMNILKKRVNKLSTNNMFTINNINNNATISNNNYKFSINDKSINNSNIINDTKEYEKKRQNKKIIEHLTMKCNDFEQKCLNIMSSYTKKEYICKNDIKIKNEYEKMLQDNLEETKLINEEYKKISLDNNKLSNVYNNTKNELDRLINVMRIDTINIKKLREEFENRLQSEKIERIRLNNILKINEKEIESLRKDAYGVGDNQNNNKNSKQNNNINKNIIINNKNSSKKKNFEIDNLNDIILELEIKISNIKKKIANTDEENDKLRNILRFKGQKDEIDKNNFRDLYNLLEYTTKNRKKELNKINEQNFIINNLMKNKNIIKIRNKLAKSLSIRKVNI